MPELKWPKNIGKYYNDKSSILHKIYFKFQMTSFWYIYSKKNFSVVVAKKCNKRLNEISTMNFELESFRL